MNIKSKKGMTLVEVIATVAIMAAIMIPISLIFTTAYSNFITESDKSIAQKSARAVLYGKGLYGNGLISYGVMGDLQRSNVGSNKIQIGENINGDSNRGKSISILDENNLPIQTYIFNGTSLDYIYLDDKGDPVRESYFENVTSNKKEVKVLDFVVEKKIKGKYIDPITNNYIDSDLIIVYVEVECGKSGKIALESSYRIPIE
ncbi:prepilin-type N-terminal cleavage/methylation domain-containing protein [Ruminiclostridium herbifermentans]|uniref:Prepilin-type N-terminal cleavage/methylation domain-containing protein n=1 Tax=Ruminiclostridium herbifermentans TaxID=2488810 RepID=A0A4U7JAZ3_9FIRM|nr:prepilin-type N-terminal cleavage/methylation domain-containing protein [Ruminiclostridium herbifermentans]QNU68114.1 prepilin-type N-terminal cleavage/methylation domain-containing protein [Ruminiclostridium herbifermentans]